MAAPTLATALAAAAALQTQPAPADAPAPSATPAVSGARVALTRVVWDLPRNAAYEVQQAGLLCITQHVATWKGDPVVYETDVYRGAFRQALRAAGVAGEGDVTELFESQEAPPDLSVGALVTALHVRACETHGFGAGSGAVHGEAKMSVEWQVFSRHAHAVVARVRTSAVATLARPIPGDAAKLFAAGLAANATELAKDESFRRALAPAAAP